MSPLILRFVIAMVSAMITYANISPRQATTAAAVTPTSTSSFNWWPYPAGGVSTTTSASIHLPTLTPIFVGSTTTFNDSPTTSLDTTHSSFSSTTLDHSSAPSLIQVTALTSLPVSSPTFGAQSPYKPSTALNPLWLIPVCIVSGAVLGLAVGWIAWRYFGEKRTKAGDIRVTEGYAFAYTHNRNVEKDDEDVEQGRGHEYRFLGRRPTYGVNMATQRMPSSASTSGARTWLEQPQARKRSGAVGAPRARADLDHETEDLNPIKSPLLSRPSASYADLESKPLPSSPHPSSHPFCEGEDGDVPYESIRHKSVRRRLWERLGFCEGDAEKQKTEGNDEQGRHTWSAGAKEGRGADVGRSFSLWSRRKTMKEGRVERWVRGVMGEDEESVPAKSLGQKAETTGSADCGETLPHPGTPELVLSTLRHVSPTTRYSQGSDDDATNTPGFEESLLIPYSSSSHHQDQITDTRLPIATTRTGQQRSVRRVEQRPRGVSLQDPGPVIGSSSTARSTFKKVRPTSRNAFPLRSSTSTHSAQSATVPSSPTPLTPSSTSRYSATPRTPAVTRLNRSPTRTPSRSTASRDLKSSLSRAVASSHIAHPTSTTAASPSRISRGSGMPLQNRPSPSRGVHAGASQGRLPSDYLPAGPSSVLSPPLQSALCFDNPPPSSTPSRTPGSTRASPMVSRTHALSSKHVSASTLPSARASSSVTASRPLSPKERHLARKHANSKVEMILSRSYSSRNFDERPISPTMFGAVITEDVEEPTSETRHDMLTFHVDGGTQGIEQRLDRREW